MATTNRYTKIQFRLQIKVSGESPYTVLSKKWKCGITVMSRPNEHSDNARPCPLRSVRGPAMICQRLRPWDVLACARRVDTHGREAATASCMYHPSLGGEGGHAGAAGRSSERAPRQNSPRSVDGLTEERIRKRPSAGASLIQQRQSSSLSVVRSTKHADRDMTLLHFLFLDANHKEILKQPSSVHVRKYEIRAIQS